MPMISRDEAYVVTRRYVHGAHASTTYFASETEPIDNGEHVERLTTVSPD